MTTRISLAVVVALGKRDLWRYFNNPTGYVFITLFIFLSGVAAFWQPGFFLRNLATLDEINAVFPYLLVFFTAALTMGTWAEERKQGTDELLLTLPARDVEIVLGKYAAVLGIYSVSLCLSLSHVLVLARLGSPDPGLIAANYAGYWVLGAALIPVGMLASVLTSHGAVSFILAALFCSAPVLVDAAADLFSQPYAIRLAPLGAFFHFNDFAQGVISLAAVAYFAGLAGFFIFLNVLAVGRHRWRRWTSGLPLPAHYAVRAVALFVALVAGTLLVSRANVRLDATAEHLHSLGNETRRLIATLPRDRTVLIQAFVSPEVPEEYVQTRESLLSTLREMEAIAGGRVQAVITDTQPYSDAARGARERFGVVPRLVSSADGVSSSAEPIFLAVTFTSGADEQIIPFLEHGLAPEYEITRAIRLVTRTSPRRIGVVDTDAGMFGGMDFEAGRSRLPWAIVNELRRQYDVLELAPSRSMTEPVDALVVVLPSMLLQHEMDNVLGAIRAGVPTLILVDPLPAMDMQLAPAASMAALANPYRDAGQGLVRKNVGDIQAFMSALGMKWLPARIAWDSYTPHPELAQLPKEVVFIGQGNGSVEPLSASHAATSGLEEVLMFYAGYLQPSNAPGVSFTPLLRTSPVAGSTSYFDAVQPTPAGPVLNVNVARPAGTEELVLAVDVRSRQGASKPSHVIAIADLDFISDQAFEMRAQAPANVSVDNVPFFLNCIDVLAGDDSFIALRTRRVRYRTLERVEAQTRAFVLRRAREEGEATADAQAALDAAQRRLENAVESIANRQDLDPLAKQMMGRNVEAIEGRRFAVLQANIEQDKATKIQASREAMEAEIRRIQSTIRTTAVLLPPVPALCLGVFIFLRRRRRERHAAAAASRLRDGA